MTPAVIFGLAAAAGLVTATIVVTMGFARAATSFGIQSIW
jgi:hypothetical protein